MMLLQPDLVVAKERYAVLLREAQTVRLANQARQDEGNQSLISRMAVLLARFGKRMMLRRAQIPHRRLASTGLH